MYPDGFQTFGFNSGGIKLLVYSHNEMSVSGPLNFDVSMHIVMYTMCTMYIIYVIKIL